MRRFDAYFFFLFLLFIIIVASFLKTFEWHISTIEKGKKKEVEREQQDSVTTYC